MDILKTVIQIFILKLLTKYEKFSVIYKVVQYMKRYNYSPYKAWMKLTKHRAFKDLMMEHYKNRKSRIYLVNRICNEYETKKNFYKNH